MDAARAYAGWEVNLKHNSIPKEERSSIPCNNFLWTGTCKNQSTCEWSHDPTMAGKRKPSIYLSGEAYLNKKEFLSLDLQREYDVLVERIKMQKANSTATNKLWHKWAEDHGDYIRDPTHHELQYLRAFLAETERRAMEGLLDDADSN